MDEKEAEARPIMGTIFGIYIRTDPITLPCSLAHAGNNDGANNLLYRIQCSTDFVG